MPILIISATNRTNSTTLILSKIISNLLTERQVKHELISLEEFNDLVSSHARYEESLELTTFNKFQDDVFIPCQKFLFIIPEYNGSFPGVLKWWIDALSVRKANESFTSKKVGLIGVSDGKNGNIRGLDHFMSICRYLKMVVLPSFVYIPNIVKELAVWDENLKYQKRVQKFIDEFLLF